MDARDNDRLYDYEKEACENCGKFKTSEGHDGCLGTLNGIANACCGHGKIKSAYVQFYDGTVVCGEDAKLIQEILKRSDFKNSKIEKLSFLAGSVKWIIEDKMNNTGMW